MPHRPPHTSCQSQPVNELLVYCRTKQAMLQRSTFSREGNGVARLRKEFDQWTPISCKNLQDEVKVNSQELCFWPWGRVENEKPIRCILVRIEDIHILDTSENRPRNVLTNEILSAKSLFKSSPLNGARHHLKPIHNWWELFVQCHTGLWQSLRACASPTPKCLNRAAFKTFLTSYPINTISMMILENWLSSKHFDTNLKWRQLSFFFVLDSGWRFWISSHPN